MPSIRVSCPSPRRLFTILNLLRLLWILLFFYFEHYIYDNAIRTCTWPLSVPPSNRLAVIADPQIVDENTYPRRGIAMWLTQFFTDRYMRRNYRLILKHQDPSTILFLGDLMDGGREWEDEKWLQEYNRFWNVFKTPLGVNVITVVPGNHDIGLGDGINIDHLNRFKTHFTALNHTSRRFRLGSFDIVLLDTPSLLSSDPQISEGPLTFLERGVSTTKIKHDEGRLLFTHIPLWRHADSDCGKQRESEKGIVMGSGYQYQNMLSEELSMKILDSCWPLTAVFSGDDHDYCVVNHTVEGRREKVPEYTVKSFSWAMVLPLVCGIGLISGSSISWISIDFSRRTNSASTCCGRNSETTSKSCYKGTGSSSLCDKTLYITFTSRWIHFIRDNGWHLIHHDRSNAHFSRTTTLLHRTQ